MCPFSFSAFLYHTITNKNLFIESFWTLENRIPVQTFEKWHNVSYRYVSY